MTFIFLLASALGLISFAFATVRTRQGRRIARQLYAEPGYLLPIRTVGIYSQVIGIGVGVLAVSSLATRPVNGWIAVPGMALIGLWVFLSYRSPQPLMPSWMRAEILDGELQVARPDLMDWILFLLLGPTFIVGLVSLMAWLTLYGGGGT